MVIITFVSEFALWGEKVTIEPSGWPEAKKLILLLYPFTVEKINSKVASSPVEGQEKTGSVVWA